MKLKPLTVIGLNSGTSMDGVDAAVFRISPKDAGAITRDESRSPRLSCQMLAQVLFEFPPALRRKMKAMIANGNASLEETCRLDAALGEEFAKAVKALLKTAEAGLHVDLIGSHGQTIWHAPQKKSFGGVSCANTLQLGQPSIIAERTGIPVIGDFRVADMAAGGQGAPLVAFADEVLFGENGSAIGILNIGGIANLTLIDGSGIARRAFDTGPGNMLIDRCCEQLFGIEFDDGGKLALKGTVDEEWLKKLLQVPYFSAPLPKTTGRELFGLDFADSLIAEGTANPRLDNESVLATISALTPASIALQYDHFFYANKQLMIEKLVLGGGGAENQFIVSQLQKRWPATVKILRHEDYGISTKFKEALLFALLAYTSYFRIPNNVPACTGASRRVCMGKFCQP